MKKKLGQASLAVAIACGAAGCASIVKGGTQEIEVKSSPPGATYQIRNNRTGQAPMTGTTPATVTLKKGDGYFKGASYAVTVSKPGYTPATASIDSSVSGWYLGGNLALGGLIGYFAVDPATGAMWKLEPEALDVTLGPAYGAGSVITPAPYATHPAPQVAGVGVHSGPATPAPAYAAAPAAPATVATLAPGALFERTPAPNAAPVRTRLLAAAPLREAPRRDRAVRAYLAAGAELEVNSRIANGDGEWWFVQTDAGRGWVSSSGQ